ncbi:MAG: hypothetical protein GF355_02995 [Candidatus Eisenbacteria bacterium]|nr:hypothetical protein [Candidatus Eisenbacteria bacterium]
MRRADTRIITAASIVVGTTGGALFWTKYLLESSDPFAVINHPWQPWILKLHVLAGPVFLFALGLVTAGHIRHHLQGAEPVGRWTGWAAMLAAAPAALTGYGIQVVTDPVLLSAIKVAHIVTGFLFLAVFAVHVAGARSRRKKLRREEAESGVPQIAEPEAGARKAAGQRITMPGWRR